MSTMISRNRQVSFFSWMKGSIWRAPLLVFLIAIGLFGAAGIVRAAVADVTVSMTDTILNDDSDNKADPGEKILYTVTINNPSGSDKSDVEFSATLDSNTTLVSGSLNVSPLAMDDSYETIGNTLLEVGVTASGHPAVTTTGNLFANDVEFFSDPFTLKQVGADTSAPFVDVATANSGLVTVDANGNFSYLPPAGFSGDDTFTYVITDAGSDDIAGNADDLTSTATVTIAVNSARVWYVKNNAAANGLGRSSDPFDTLAEAVTASAAGDTIYVFTGDGLTTGQNSGISLKSGQRLLGEGVALTVPVGMNGNSSPTTLRSAGTKPKITATLASEIAVSVDTNTIAGNLGSVEIRGLDISASGSLSNAIDVTTHSTFGGTVEIANNTISGALAEGIDINGGATDANAKLIISLHDNIVTATGNGIDIRDTAAGSVYITAFDDNMIAGSTGGLGIYVYGTSGTVVFDDTPDTTPFTVVSGGSTSVGSSGAGNGAGTGGMSLQNVRGALTFDDLDLYADTGTAFLVNGSTPNYNQSGGSGFQLIANTNTPTLYAASGSALDVTDARIDLNLYGGLTSTSSSVTKGISLTRVSGALTVPSGSSITSSNSSGTGFFVNGGSNANANVDVTYNGTITADVGKLVEVQNVTATGSDYLFTGAITDNDDGDSGEQGVILTTNSGATITFAGGLKVRTTTNAAFTATGGGTIHVCDEYPCNSGATGALENKLTSTTGTALNVANTTIGSNNLEFRSIASNGAANGIVLNTTGSSGGLKVKGTGSAGSGGTIQNTTGAGVSLTSTNNVSLAYMTIQNSGLHGVEGTTVGGFTLTNSTVSSNGNAAGERGLNFSGLTGTVSITSNTISNSYDQNIYISNSSGALDFTASGNTVSNSDSNVATQNDNGVEVTLSGTATATARVRDNTTFNNNDAGVILLSSDTADLDYIVSGNTMNGGIYTQVYVANFSTAGGTQDGMIQNNTITTSTSSVFDAFGVQINHPSTSQPQRVTISNNTITYHGIYGILVTNEGNSSRVDATIQNNTLNTGINANVSITPDYAIFAITGNASSATSAMCVNMTGNSENNGNPNITADVRVREYSGATFYIQNLSPSSAATAGQTQTHLTNNNTFNSAVATTSNSFDAQNCNTPSVSALPSLNGVAKADLNSYALSTQSQAAGLQKQNADLTARAGVSLLPANLVNPASGRGLFAPRQSGETVNASIGDLPDGRTIIIQYQAQVNDPLPFGTTQISHQGTVSGTGFSAVQSDDSSVGGTTDPTITPVDRPDTTVLSINRDGSSTTDASSVSWTVTFAHNVQDLTDSNFTLAASGLTGTSITDVSPVGIAPDNEWTVTASTGAGETGTLGLNFTDDSGLSHDVTNASVTGQVYSISRVPPSVTTSGGTTSFTEADGATSTPVAIDGALTVSDSDSATLASGTVSITGNFQSGEDVLAFTNDGSTMGNISGSYNSGTGELTLTSAGATATLAEWQSALRAATYNNSSDLPNTSTRTISFTVNDGISNSVAATKDVSVASVNDDPINSVPAAQSVQQDSSLTFNAANSNLISISDADAGANIVQVTLTATNGLVTLSGITGLGFIAGDGTNDSTMTFDGAITDVNAALNGLTFAPTGGYYGSASLEIATSDFGHSGSGGAKTDTDTISITVNGFNPTITNVTSSNANGTYKIGDTIFIHFVFDMAVNVNTSGGVPTLTLETGTTDRLATYVSGSGSDTLTFMYTVQSGDVSADLDYQSASALALNGATIIGTGNNLDAVLTLPAVGGASSIAGQKNLVIDGIAPQVASSTLLSSYALGAGPASFDVIFTEDVTDPQTFLLVERGTNEAFDTLSCAGGVQSGDTQVNIQGVAYDQPSSTSTLTLNSALPGGRYRLFVCAANTDLAGNNLNGSSGYNTDHIIDFNVRASLMVYSNNKHDGWVLKPQTTTWTTPLLSTASIAIGDNTQNRQFRSILSFNTVSLPSDAVITSAYFQMKKKEAKGKTNTYGAIYFDIRKGAFGTSALQKQDFSSAASKAKAGTLTSAPSGWYLAELPPASFSFVNPSGLTQFRVYFGKSTDNDGIMDALIFYDGGAPLASKPVLVIEYYVP